VSRPLLITDCDEVLLHMVSHFRTWLDEAHAIDFTAHTYSMVRRSDGQTLARDEAWPLLGGFFDTEMHRQTLVPHAREALAEISDYADVVVLTNLEDHRQPHRVEQLRGFGIDFRVVTNQGGKGKPVRALLDEYSPSAAVFVDDLAVHHASVAEDAPEVWRLHMISDPDLAGRIPAAPAAHARIDDWAEAKGWIANKLNHLTDSHKEGTHQS
jgi:FMN phosphatase YigB (HAD superfamily)